MRANTNIQLKSIKQLRLGDFRGVDFSSSPLRVQQNRASNAVNFINEYGINKKRNGWNALFGIKDVNGKPVKINGIFNYSNKDYKVLLIHAGNRFYRVDFDIQPDKYAYVDITFSSTYLPAMVEESSIISQRSQVFFNKGRAYIIGCGDFLVYGSWNGGDSYELRRVANNEDTYIPTTTTSISNDSIIDDEARFLLDEINCLTDKRKNKLSGVETFPTTWTVDTKKIDIDTTIEIVVETIQTVDNKTQNITKNISNNGADRTKLYNGDTEVGSVNFENGKVTLNIATSPYGKTLDNILIIFNSRVEGIQDRITKCSFGALFGVGGNNDTLFLSGNNNYPNQDFWSTADDYTYFAERDNYAMGSNAVPIMGYSRLADSTLVILKAETAQEASIYYRTGQYKENVNSQGGVINIEINYPVYAGSIGEGVVSRYAIANLAGDNLMLSSNGVFGIVLSSNIATSERYARERSRAINERLTRHNDLSNSVGIVYKNKYYLAVNGVCYIADARFKYTSEGDIEDTFNYEWWYWDNIPARVWANIGNDLYFGTENGMVCVFDDKYIDRTCQISNEGDLAINIPNNTITFNPSAIKLAENDVVRFTDNRGNDLHSLFADNVQVKNSKIVTTEAEILKLYDGIRVCADNVGQSGLNENAHFTVINVDKGTCEYQLKYEQSDKIVTINEGGFRLHRCFNEKNLFVTNITNTSFQVKESKESEPLSFSKHNKETPSFIRATFVHAENVIAKWISPIFDLGTNETSKTLLKMTISTEPEVNGKVSFGYETKNLNKLFNAKGINIFSFDDFSFENFSFDTKFANSYSVKVKERNFNFIMFQFVSDNEYNCAINNFTAMYKINSSNKGVR